MRTHGGLTEDSHTYSLTAPIGKGREGKGREIGREAPLTLACGSSVLTSQNQVQSVTREAIGSGR